MAVLVAAKESLPLKRQGRQHPPQSAGQSRRLLECYTCLQVAERLSTESLRLLRMFGLRQRLASLLRLRAAARNRNGGSVRPFPKISRSRASFPSGSRPQRNIRANQKNQKKGCSYESRHEENGLMTESRTYPCVFNNGRSRGPTCQTIAGLGDRWVWFYCGGREQLRTFGSARMAGIFSMGANIRVFFAAPKNADSAVCPRSRRLSLSLSGCGLH